MQTESPTVTRDRFIGAINIAIEAQLRAAQRGDGTPFSDEQIAALVAVGATADKVCVGSFRRYRFDLDTDPVCIASCPIASVPSLYDNGSGMTGQFWPFVNAFDGAILEATDRVWRGDVVEIV